MSKIRSLTQGWAWLVGVPDDEYGFVACEHCLVRVNDEWHSLRGDSRTTVCGLPVPDGGDRARALHTECDGCGMELARARRAFHAPWALIVDSTYAAHHGGLATETEGVHP